jgi:hypothetical protein
VIEELIYQLMYGRVVEKQLIQKPRDTVDYEGLVEAGADAI